MSLNRKWVIPSPLLCLNCDIPLLNEFNTYGCWSPDPIIKFCILDSAHHIFGEEGPRELEWLISNPAIPHLSLHLLWFLTTWQLIPLQEMACYIVMLQLWDASEKEREEIKKEIRGVKRNGFFYSYTRINFFICEFYIIEIEFNF